MQGVLSFLVSRMLGILDTSKVQGVLVVHSKQGYLISGANVFVHCKWFVTVNIQYPFSLTLLIDLATKYNKTRSAHWLLWWHFFIKAFSVCKLFGYHCLSCKFLPDVEECSVLFDDYLGWLNRLPIRTLCRGHKSYHTPTIFTPPPFGPQRYC